MNIIIYKVVFIIALLFSMYYYRLFTLGKGKKNYFTINFIYLKVYLCCGGNEWCGRRKDSRTMAHQSAE
ncbi:MAG: hypothetical protein LBB84_00655 [Tannerellaceae bacterium]|jgi:hypothetical protein|nr:hypothetical protein [Tannerellaceae bacterium]